MSRVVVSEGTISYQVDGRGRPVVFIHGWLGSWRYWYSTMDALSKSRAYAFDLWGFGDSDKIKAHYNIDAYVKLIKGFLDKLGIVHPVLVGHALGGLVALKFAAEYPDWVDQVVGISVPLIGDSISRPLANFSGNHKALVRLASRRAKFPEVEMGVRKTDVDAVTSTIKLALECDLRPVLPPLEIPVLLVYGENDPFIKPPEPSWLRYCDNNVRAISLKGARHFPMLEDSSLSFNKLLADFLTMGDDLSSLSLRDERGSKSVYTTEYRRVRTAVKPPVTAPPEPPVTAPPETRPVQEIVQPSTAPPGEFSWDIDRLAPQYRDIVQRQDVIDRITNVLESTDAQRMVLLYGPPLVGKTFVLRRLTGALQDTYLPVYINVNGWASRHKLSDFLYELATIIRIDVESSRYEHRIRPFNRLSELEAPAEFSAFMDNLVRIAQGEGKHVLLMFDELEYLVHAETDERIFEYLAGFVDAYFQQIRFIFTGPIYMPNLWQRNQALAALFSKATPIRLGCFDNATSRELLTALTAPHFSFEPQVIDRLVQFTDGHPRILGSALAIIAHNWKDKWQRDKVDERDISAVTESICTELGPVLMDIWRRLLLPEQQVLQEIAGRDKSFTVDEVGVGQRASVESSLEQLVQRQILDYDPQDERYTVRLGILVEAISYGILESVSSLKPRALGRKAALARIELMMGDLLEQDSDVLVHPTNPNIDFSGGIGRQLWEHLDSELYARLSDQIPVELGSAVVTEAGSLPARYLIHTPTSKSDPLGLTVESIIVGFSAALAKAEELSNVRSIAFPSFSTGAAGFDPGDVAPGILAAAVAHLEQGSQLDQVLFVFINEATGQAYTDAYRSLGGEIEAKRVPTHLWHLSFDDAPLDSLAVGQRFTPTLRLSPTEQPGSQPLCIPVSALELTVYVEAPGLYLEGEHIRTLPVSEGRPVEHNLALDLIPLISGEQRLRLLVYPGQRVEGLQPAELSQIVSITPPLALPDIRELIDRRAIPDPQPNVMLYAALEEATDGQQLRLHLTCPALGLDREPFDPLPFTEQDLAGLRQAAVRMAGAAVNTSSPDALSSLRAFGRGLFDRLMPPGYPLRELYWRIFALAARSDTPWSWLVVSDERAMLPWELVCPYMPRPGRAELWHDEFLGRKFVLVHWVGQQGLTLASEAPLGLLDFTHYQQRPREIVSRWQAVLGGEVHVGVEDETGHLALMQADSRYYGLHILRYSDRYQLGQITALDGQQARPATDRSEAEMMIFDRRLDFTLRRPVVGFSFVDEQPVNLDMGLKGRDTQLEAGWMLPFMHAGATALVGARWSVTPEADQLFFRTFYQTIRNGVPLGQAVWEAREQVRLAFPHRPDWLAYAYFGHPWCQPYWVRPAQGFTLFETIDHPEDDSFLAGEMYRFRASYRAEPPAGYDGRLHVQVEPLQAEPPTVMIIPITATEPTYYTLERVPQSDEYQCLVELAMPEKKMIWTVLISFQNEREELATVTLNLNVVEGK